MRSEEKRNPEEVEFGAAWPGMTDLGDIKKPSPLSRPHRRRPTPRGVGRGLGYVDLEFLSARLPRRLRVDRSRDFVGCRLFPSVRIRTGRLARCRGVPARGLVLGPAAGPRDPSPRTGRGRGRVFATVEMRGIGCAIALPAFRTRGKHRPI